ncbi:MAG: hypothetical protein P4L76_01570 [Beijerinckiaceae bacterium]|nr:hypothetical protein [Beijerinckiaceae bacterium]
MSDTKEHANGKAALSLITLHLARCQAFPEGSSTIGYRFIAPLDSQSRINPADWNGLRQRCLVNRFRDGEPGLSGHLVHKPGGAGGATWYFDYAAAGAEEAVKHLDEHRFLPGEYVSIQAGSGDWETYKIVDVRLVADQ